MPMKKSAQETALDLFKKKQGWLRTRQALDLGISSRTLYALRDAGKIIQENRGLYRLASMELSSNKDLIQVSLQVPKGVVCLISALDFYGVTTQIPHFVYLAMPANTEKPRIKYPPLRIFKMSPKIYEAGIQKEIVDGIPLKIYSLEKTIADSFKFRKKIGMDVALEALRQAIEEKRCNLDLLMQYARLNRVASLITPYLEALL
ncbi:MAG: transcriptional regulator [Anaerolineae bacterium]|jgi:predicted transcriptional regulator of viral defense system|nr:transcriptional regulator [Anaerolineae bacterium]MBT7071378.1 transcriptional regulator [Anaerolineae bacterium]